VYAGAGTGRSAAGSAFAVGAWVVSLDSFFVPLNSAAGSSSNGFPHIPQNRCMPGLSVPQYRQSTRFLSPYNHTALFPATASGFPHSGQWALF
jgi:hypothetical protein